MKKTNNMSDKSQMQSTLVQVAHLYYNENLSQQKIADYLGVSRSLIAQYLKNARETGISFLSRNSILVAGIWSEITSNVLR